MLCIACGQRRGGGKLTAARWDVAARWQGAEMVQIVRRFALIAWRRVGSSGALVLPNVIVDPLLVAIIRGAWV
jgi:hypothetical protein